MRLLLLATMLILTILGCNSREETAKEKFVPPWEGPKNAARATKEQVEGSAREVDKQLAEMDDDQEEADSK